MPYDGTMLAIVERFRLNMNFSRTILEGAGLLAAYFIGGPVGLGSVVFVFFLGAFIQICSRGAEKAAAKIINFQKKLIYLGYTKTHCKAKLSLFYNELRDLYKISLLKKHRRDIFL
ncbi:hypothetical protein GCM10020331_069560 [Ectobacillus funiculus]